MSETREGIVEHNLGGNIDVIKCQWYHYCSLNKMYILFIFLFCRSENKYDYICNFSLIHSRIWSIHLLVIFILYDAQDEFLVLPRNVLLAPSFHSIAQWKYKSQYINWPETDLLAFRVHLVQYTSLCGPCT